MTPPSPTEPHLYPAPNRPDPVMRGNHRSVLLRMQRVDGTNDAEPATRYSCTSCDRIMSVLRCPVFDSSLDSDS